jgi:hypothetical protein
MDSSLEERLAAQRLKHAEETVAQRRVDLQRCYEDLGAKLFAVCRFSGDAGDRGLARGCTGFDQGVNQREIGSEEEAGEVVLFVVAAKGADESSAECADR